MELPRNEEEEIIGERLRRIEDELTQTAGEKRKKKADLQYLSDLRDDLRAYLNLTVGQVVTDGKRLGLSLSYPSRRWVCRSFGLVGTLSFPFPNDPTG